MLSQLPLPTAEFRRHLFPENQAWMEGVILDRLMTPPDAGWIQIADLPAWCQMAFIPSDPAAFLEDRRSARRVFDVLDWAAEEGATEAVLGSLTSPKTRAGVTAAAHIDAKGWDQLKVSTGNAETAAVVDGLVQDLVGEHRDTVVGIIGLGNIGRMVLLKLIARGQHRVIVIDRTQVGLDNKLLTVDRGDTLIEGSDNPAMLTTAHLILCTTAAPKASIRPEHFTDRRVAIVDLSVPAAVAPPPPAQRSRWAELGHLVITRGAQVSIGSTLPEELCTRTGANPGEYYPCLLGGVARAIATARGWDCHRTHQVGDIDERHMNWFTEIMPRLGWKRAPLRMWDDESITEDEVRELLADARHNQRRVLTRRG